VKWGSQISNGGPGTTGPPAGDGPGSKTPTAEVGLQNLLA